MAAACQFIYPDYPLLGGQFNGRTAHRNHVHMNVLHYRRSSVATMWNGVKF